MPVALFLADGAKDLVVEGGGQALHLLGHLLVAEVLVGLATDTTVYLSRHEEALTVNKLIFTNRASLMSP